MAVIPITLCMLCCAKYYSTLESRLLRKLNWMSAFFTLPPEEEPSMEMSCQNLPQNQHEEETAILDVHDLV